jgi:hypothetical protein
VVLTPSATLFENAEHPPADMRDLLVSVARCFQRAWRSPPYFYYGARFFLGNAVHTGMQFTIPFKGTQSEGVQRIKQLLLEQDAKIRENTSEFTQDWKDNVLTFAFTAQGKSISGTLAVLDGEFDVYAKLPLAMRLFEGTIEKMIQSEVQKLVR